MYGARRWHLSTDGGVFEDAEEIPGETVLPSGEETSSGGEQNKKDSSFSELPFK